MKMIRLRTKLVDDQMEKQYNNDLRKEEEDQIKKSADKQSIEQSVDNEEQNEEELDANILSTL